MNFLLLLYEVFVMDPSYIAPCCTKVDSKILKKKKISATDNGLKFCVFICLVYIKLKRIYIHKHAESVKTI